MYLRRIELLCRPDWNAIFFKATPLKLFAGDGMKKIVSTLFVIVVYGCAVPTTGVVTRGEGMSTITRQGNGFWVTTESLKVAAIQEADTYCQLSGRRVKVIHTKEIPAGALGRWPESEILFRCE